MAAAIALADVQGIILRSYGMDELRLFALQVQDPALARRALAQLPIAAGTPWDTKPDFCVNVGITFAGLQALKLPDASLATFPEEFRLGAPQRASLIGDTGDSAPDHWLSGFGDNGVHILVTLYAQTKDILEAQSSALTTLWATGLSLALTKDASMLPGNLAHFGFRDGFSQPAIEGGLPNPLADPLPKAPAGEFLLGYPSQFNQFTYPFPQPDALGLNGSFLALRILEQDCVAFEELLNSAPAKFGIDGEKLAAKMVGRWRNGVPLGASPDTPNSSLPLEQFNNYDYLDDPKGFKCPIGAHMRRNNPRSSPVAGGIGTNHRIVRRGLPYGAVFDPSNPSDGIERGLLGLFIAVSLKDQFEFLMTQWVNGSLFAAGLGQTKDPILGDHTDGQGKFVIPVQGGPAITVSGFSRLVKTRAAAYAFLPSLSALHFIAQL